MPAEAPAGFALDTPWIRRSFDRAADTYDSAAVLHEQVRNDLLARLQLMAIAPRVVLDAGTGTGHASRALKRRYPKSLVIALDSSTQMLRVAARRRSWLHRFERVQADAGNMPLPDGSVDLIFSNLMLQWCDPEAVLEEFSRVLAPRGLLCFTTLGPDTLRELRLSWSQVDDAEHVNAFTDMHDVGDALVRAGFASPVLDVEVLTVSYAEVRRLTADLRAVGACQASPSRLKGLSSPRKFAAMTAAYEQFRREGRLPATYEVVFAHAWGPAAGARDGAAGRGAASHGAASRGANESGVISLQEVERQLKKRRRP